MPSADAAGRASIGGPGARSRRGENLPIAPGAGPVAVTLFDQPQRRVMHLVSLNGDTRYRPAEVLPIGRVAGELGIPAGRTVKRLRRLWDQADVPFQRGPRDHVSV